MLELLKVIQKNFHYYERLIIGKAKLKSSYLVTGSSELSAVMRLCLLHFPTHCSLCPRMLRQSVVMWLVSEHFYMVYM